MSVEDKFQEQRVEDAAQTMVAATGGWTNPMCDQPIEHMRALAKIVLKAGDALRMRVYKVGSFYPYYVVAARSEEEAIEVVKASKEPAEGAGLPEPFGKGDWIVEELDTTKPGVIEGNAG